MRFRASTSDESFGPGTDLVISLLVCLLVLMTLDSYHDHVLWILASEQEPIPERICPACPECPSCPKGEIMWIQGKGEAFFEKNKATLTQQARDQLAARVGWFRSTLETGQYQQLQVVGHASADTARGTPAVRERRNFVLSFERALAVADFLYQQRIPYECLAVTAWGRSRSEVLASWLRSGDSLRAWDDHGQYERQEPAESLEGERRVEIWGLDETGLGARESVCPLLSRSGDTLANGSSAQRRNDAL